MEAVEQPVSQSYTEIERTVESISILASKIAFRNEKIIARYGLTSRWMKMLHVLQGAFPQPLTLTAVSKKWTDKRSDLSRMVGRMLKAELIEREQSPSNPKVKGIVISQKGLNTLDELEKERDALVEPITVLSDKEIQQFNFLLDKILYALEE